MKHFLKIAPAALLALVAGCAAPSNNAAGASDPAAICHFCRYHNDLASVCVNVKDNTPRTEYQGQTCYFLQRGVPGGVSEEAHPLPAETGNLKRRARMMPPLVCRREN